MEQIAIRSIQHFLYCRHRWGLMDIDCAWAENAFVTRANIIHEHVHTFQEQRINGKKVYTDLTVWNDDYGIQGKLDCLEMTAEGLTIIEFKPTKPKSADYYQEDAIQMFAQKLCIDRLFGCSCKCQIYDSDVRRRVNIPVDTYYSQFDVMLKDTLGQMRQLIAEGHIPPVAHDQKCNGCSMKDLCIPSTAKKRGKGLRELIEEVTESEL